MFESHFRKQGISENEAQQHAGLETSNRITVNDITLQNNVTQRNYSYYQVNERY